MKSSAAILFTTLVVLGISSIEAQNCNSFAINACLKSYFDQLGINFTRNFQEFQRELDDQFYPRYSTSEGQDVFCAAVNNLPQCMGPMWPGCMSVANAMSVGYEVQDAYAFVAWFYENPYMCQKTSLQILKDNYKCIGDTKMKYYAQFGQCYADYIEGVTAAGANGMPSHAICDGPYYKECSPKVARVMCDTAGVGFNYIFTSYCDPMCEIYGSI